MDKLTIGKMAKINGVSEQTLRLYDKMHLLVPKEINADTGYRYYNIRQCAKLDMIQNMKALGMNLSQIKEYFDAQHKVSKLEEMLRQQKINIHQEIERLQYAEMALNRAIENCSRYDTIPREEIPVIEYLPERCVYIHDTGENCYERSMDYYETLLRTLKQNYTRQDFPMGYFCDIGKIVRQKSFMNGEMVATEACIFMEGYPKNDKALKTIPGGVYLCMYREGYENEQDTLRKLMHYITDHEYQVTGDCISEIILELPVSEEYHRNAFFKIQVPIQSRNRKE